MKNTIEFKKKTKLIQIGKIDLNSSEEIRTEPGSFSRETFIIKTDFNEKEKWMKEQELRRKEANKKMIELFNTCDDFEFKSNGSYDGGVDELIFYKYELESNEEFTERKRKHEEASEKAKIAAEKRAASNKKREKSLYESLKKKFEKA
jgi:hypothetical protein